MHLCIKRQVYNQCIILATFRKAETHNPRTDLTNKPGTAQHAHVFNKEDHKTNCN